MKKLVLLLIPFMLLARMYNPDDVCKDTKLVMQEAKMINDKFKDPTNAVNLLGAGAFRSVMYRKPQCMDEKLYLNYLDKYSFYLSKSRNYNSYRMIENFIKRYPKHSYFYLSLGKSYEKQYYENNRIDARQKALETYETYIKLAQEQKQNIDKKVLAFVKSGGLKKADETWGKYLNPKSIIPVGKFKAFYIDIHKPKDVIASEIVDDISVNYPYKDFYNIDSSSFGGYWVGKVKFNKDTKKVIYLSQSNSTTRIIVDGYILYDGPNRTAIEYTFKKGMHTIEVEHINRWHTTNLVVKILYFTKKYDRKELKSELDKVISKDVNFWYVGAYESEKQDNSISLIIQKSKKPVVLLLESQRVVTYKIQNAYKTKIEAIVIHSSTPESTVEGDIKGVKVLYSKYRIGSGYNSGLPTKRDRNCKCIVGHFTCGGSGGFNANMIPSMYNKKVDGFSGKYASSILAVPQLELTAKVYREIDAYNTKIQKMRASCYKNKSVNVNDLFKSK
jgi:hypothetical protein